MNKDINAIGIVKQMVADGQISQEVAEKYFPELKESEDGKTKRLLHTIANKMGQHLRDIFTEEEYQCFDAWSNAWLEKQGQDGKVWFYRDDYVRDKKQAYQDGIDNVLNNPQKYGLEKREIKEHDVCDTCDEKASCVNPCPTKLIGEQKPAWSEKEEKLINSVIELIDNGALDRDEKDYFIEKLKSLKDRFTWKPSDEQIGVIEAIINNRSFQRRYLDSLYADLKKLKG